MSPRGTAKISAAIRLRTVELYLETGSYRRAAEALEKETGIKVHETSVRQRVMLEGVTSRSKPWEVIQILDRLQREVESEKAAGIELPARGSIPSELSLEEKIRTLEAFVENYRYAATGRALGIGGDAAKNRLVRILGEQNAYPVYAKTVLADLQKERDKQ